MLCPQCQKEDAVENPEYGILPGSNCQAENAKVPKPSQDTLYDFASPLTKLHRKEYGSEMYQPYVDGVLSREFIEANGTDKLAGVGPKEIKNAKYVYKNMTRHHKTLQGAKTKKQNISKQFASK